MDKDKIARQSISRGAFQRMDIDAPKSISREVSSKPIKYKKPTKLRDLGRKKSANEIKGRLQAAAKSGQKTKYYVDLKTLAKRANQRMLRMERAGYKSPAYQQVQAQLEMFGIQGSGDRGRRFSETGKATYNQYQALMKVLNEFVSDYKTSTVSGYKKYMDDVWQGARQSEKIAVDLDKAGITKEQWFEMWSALPDKRKRNFDSSEYIEALATFNIKHGAVKGGEFNVYQMIKEFEESQDLSSAWASIGISDEDYQKAEDMGVL